jgi:hypothetical protein
LSSLKLKTQLNFINFYALKENEENVLRAQLIQLHFERKKTGFCSESEFEAEQTAIEKESFCVLQFEKR